MKQIDIIKAWSKKRCLIVDDIADVRASIKRWMVDYGCNEVDTAGNAEEAIDLCQHHSYDVVLADYNLGQGKNGQQLLEELRVNKLVSNTALFIMITAEVDSHYVLHALEYQPDDYLNKPLNRNSLRKRLDTALLKNEALRPIKAALDERSVNRAITAAEKSLDSIEEKYLPDLKRALGELYCENKQWEKAREIYTQIPGNNSPLWCRLGAARTDIGLMDYAQAEKALEYIISEFPMCVEARDLLAVLYDLQDLPLRRQEILSQAVKISPRSSTRQRALGDACTDTGEHSQAVHAWRSALKHSKNTCQEIPDDYLALVDSLNLLANESRDGKIEELTSEAFNNLKIVEKKYSRHPVVQIRSKQLRAEVYDIQGKAEDYRAELAKALEILNELDYNALRTTSTKLCIDSARTFMNHGYYEEGEKLLEELAALTDDPILSVQIDKLRREPQTREGITYASRLNKVGISHYENKEYAHAQESFSQVLNELPNHTGLNLNLLQVLVTKSQKEELDEKDLHLLTTCFRRVKHVDSMSPHFKRFQYIREKCLALQQEETHMEETK